MTHLATLWDVPREAEEARDAALLQVAAHSVPWRTVAWDVLLDLARNRVFLTSDDLTEAMVTRGYGMPAEGRAVGPVMQRGIREGVLVPAGYVKGRNPKHHADVCRLYTSGLVSESELRALDGNR